MDYVKKIDQANHSRESADKLPRLMIIGGPDVDKRIEMMDLLCGEFSCAAVGSTPDLKKCFESKGYPYWCYQLSRKYNPLADIRSIIQLFFIIRRFRPDIVHCFDTVPCLVGRIAAFLVGVSKIIGTLPGLGTLYTFSTPSIRRKRAIIRLYHKLSCHLSHRTVFQNSDDQRTFIEEGIVSSQKSHLIHGSGVSKDRFGPNTFGSEVRRQARQHLGIDDQSEVITMVTRLTRSKGILDLADAAPHVYAQRPFCRILIAGPRETEALDSLNPDEMNKLQANLDWVGDKVNIPELMAASDIFVFPSYYREGIPRVLIEAAFANVPIVTTNNVGCREVVEHGVSGILVEPRHPENLAKGILQVLNDPESARCFAVAARENALQRFELHTIVENHRALYKGDRG